MCLWEHFVYLCVGLLDGGICPCLLIPLWTGRWPRQANSGIHIDWQYRWTSALAFDSSVEGAQRHIVWLRRLRQILMLILNRTLDAD